MSQEGKRGKEREREGNRGKEREIEKGEGTHSTCILSWNVKEENSVTSPCSSGPFK